jgi:hypothetical protein
MDARDLGEVETRRRLHVSAKLAPAKLFAEIVFAECRASPYEDFAGLPLRRVLLHSFAEQALCFAEYIISPSAWFRRVDSFAECPFSRKGRRTNPKG